jgi:hypothetical protein
MIKDLTTQIGQYGRSIMQHKLKLKVQIFFSSTDVEQEMVQATTSLHAQDYYTTQSATTIICKCN